jgi:hypothetical protein
MSEPRKHGDNKIQGALCEVASAMSALNMEPDPLKAPLGRGYYLSELDGWAAHCIDHLHVVFEYLNEAYQEHERDRYKICQLELQNTELRKKRSWEEPKHTHDPNQPCSQTPECYWCEKKHWQHGTGPLTETRYTEELIRIGNEMHDTICDIKPCDSGCNVNDWVDHVISDLVLLGAAAGKEGIIPKSSKTGTTRAEAEALRGLEEPLRRTVSILESSRKAPHQAHDTSFICDCGLCSAIEALEHLDAVRKHE